MLSEGSGPKERTGTEVPDEFIKSGTGVADKILKAKEEARRRLKAEEDRERRKSAKAEKAKTREKERQERREAERRRRRS